MSFVPYFAVLSGNQSVLIPGGTKSFHINVVSGGATVNAVYIPVATVINGGGLDSKEIMYQSNSGVYVSGFAGGCIIVNWDR